MNDSKFGPWGILSSLFLLTAGFIAYAIVPASVLPLIMAEFTIDRPTASASITAIFLTWALLQMPGGYVADRYDVRRLVALGASVFLLAAGAGLLVESYAAFVFTRLLGGASVVLIFVGSVKILGRVLPERRKALGMSVFIASPPFGIALAQFSGPLIAQPYGWRGAMLAYTAIAAVGFIGLLAFLGEPIRATERVTASQFLAALRTRSILLVSATSACTYTIWTFLVTWMPSYGTDVLGFDLAAAGAATALVPLAGIVGRPAGGWISELLDGRLSPVIAASFLTSIVLLYALSGASSPVTFAILLALTGASVNLAVGLYLVYVDLLADAVTQGTSLSVLITFSQIGNLVAPVVGGWTIERFSWTAGFGFVIGIAVLGLATIFVVSVTNREATSPTPA